MGKEAIELQKGSPDAAVRMSKSWPWSGPAVLPFESPVYECFADLQKAKNQMTLRVCK